MSSILGRPNAYTADQFIKAIQGSGGIVTTIAKRIGCSWNTAYKYIHTHPTVAQAYQDEQESILDMAEGVVFKNIKDGDSQDAKWLLSRKGKHRGYVERQELDVDISKVDEAIERQLARLARTSED